MGWFAHRAKEPGSRPLTVPEGAAGEETAADSGSGAIAVDSVTNLVQSITVNGLSGVSVMQQPGIVEWRSARRKKVVVGPLKTGSRLRVDVADVRGSAGSALTTDQAKSRIEEAGYASVFGLRKDLKGAWRATAVKDGQTVTVTLDADGTVTQITARSLPNKW